MQNFISNPEAVTDNLEKLAALNMFNVNYNFTTAQPYNKEAFNYEEESEKTKLAILKDFTILSESYSAYIKNLKNDKPTINEALLLPDGQIVYFCHIHENSAQTCGGGSFNLSKSGFISHSGGLDSGVNFEDIQLTTNFSTSLIWFSHNGFLKANCGINANICVRVWETKPGANLSGVPQIERLRKKKEKESSEQITLINGNGNEYKKHIPEIIIESEFLNDYFLNHLNNCLKLEFKPGYQFKKVYRAQPQTMEQILQAMYYLTNYTMSRENDIINQNDDYIVFTPKK